LAAGLRSSLAQSPERLREVLEFEKSLDLRIERIGQYAGLRTTEDSANSESLAREAQLENLLTRIGEAASFLSPEIQAVDAATFERFLASPVLAEWRTPLQRLRRLKPHMGKPFPSSPTSTCSSGRSPTKPEQAAR
jgi:oligoendopeptidase F